MAWVDSMRLRRRADKIRAIGWGHLLLTIVLSVLHAGDGLSVLAFAILWAAGVMALTHGAGWMLDKQAVRVVRR